MDDGYGVPGYDDGASSLLNNTDTDFMDNSGDSGDDDTLVEILKTATYFFVALGIFCYCARPHIPPPEMRRGAEIRERYQAAQARIARQNKLADPELRQQAIRQALIIKQITKVDEQGEMILGDVDPEAGAAAAAGNTQSGTDDYENEDSACVICLEPFQCGDVVAWSREMANNDCQHVFHRECIGEWLQNTKHDDCPSCRTIFLHEGDQDQGAPVDGMPTSTASSMAFVMMNGLVSRVRRASISLSLMGGHHHPPAAHELSEDEDSKPPPVATPSTTRRVIAFGSPWKRSSMESKIPPVPTESENMEAATAAATVAAVPLRRVSVGPGASPTHLSKAPFDSAIRRASTRSQPTGNLSFKASVPILFQRSQSSLSTRTDEHTTQGRQGSMPLFDAVRANEHAEPLQASESMIVFCRSNSSVSWTDDQGKASQESVSIFNGSDGSESSSDQEDDILAAPSSKKTIFRGSSFTLHSTSKDLVDEQGGDKAGNDIERMSRSHPNLFRQREGGDEDETKMAALHL